MQTEHLYDDSYTCKILWTCQHPALTEFFAALGARLNGFSFALFLWALETGIVKERRGRRLSRVRGYYRDRGDSRPTFEMTVLFSVRGLCKSDPPEHRETQRKGREGKEILEHVFATFRARYRENLRWKVGPVDDPREDKSWKKTREILATRPRTKNHCSRWYKWKIGKRRKREKGRDRKQSKQESR